MIAMTRSAEAAAREKTTNILEMLTTALRMMVKYVMNARMRPTSHAPEATRAAPATMTATCALLRISPVDGPTRAIMPLAFFSLRMTSREMLSKRARSTSVLESALMTRTPVMFSCTLRTMPSTASCTRT